MCALLFSVRLSQKRAKSRNLIEMRTGIKVECHKAQPVKSIVGFCDTCKKVFCKVCMVDHIGHTTMKIKDFCEEKKVSIYELAARLEEERKRKIEITTKLKEGSIENNVALFIAER